MIASPVLFAWPKPYGGPSIFTVLQDYTKEVEWQRTQHALGRPVDVNALFDVIDHIGKEVAEEIREKSASLDEAQRESRGMVDAIDQAIEDLNKEVRTRMSEEIIGRLNKIDRHDVSTIIKEVIVAISVIQDNMRRARA